MKRGLPIHPEIPECANRVLRDSGFPLLSNGIGIDVEAIIEDFCGIEIAWISGLRLGGRELLAAYISDIHTILIEADCNPHRQRFSLAHELGHAQLEHGFGSTETLFQMQEPQTFLCVSDDTTARSSDERSKGRRRRLEIRANQFASLLLMPEALVRQVWQKYHDIVGCSQLLGVSRQAMEIKLEHLKLGSATFDARSQRLI